MNSFYSRDELLELGFKTLGEHVLISRKASIYNASCIEIGNHVRIDDFCVISGNISFGDYIHISMGTGLFAGNAGIVLEDYTTVSSRFAVYAVSDDYSGESMTNPMVPDEYRDVTEKRVIIKKHTIIGTGSTILPGVMLGEGTSVGAMSLINRDTEPWTIYAGIPVRKIKLRSQQILEI